MPAQIASTAMIKCSFGDAPVPLLVTSNVITKVNNLAAATVMDFAPIANIPTFGMCKSPANPTVAAATAAALGVLTPMPCIPATVAPWVPGSLVVKVGAFAALTKGCTLACTYGGLIEFSTTGQGVDILDVT